jgi:adenylosuccinate lyase
VRVVKRSGIGELAGACGKKQVGVSTMPHKRNPIKSGEVCGLARIGRSAVEAALANNGLWDERDLTNSSPERVLFPEASVLTDHILNVMIDVMEGLEFNRQNIRKNLMMLRGVNLAESVMIDLTKRGMNRQEAHEVMRTASMQALAEDRDLAEVLAQRPEVTEFVTRDDLDALLDPDAYVGTAVRQVERLVEKLLPLCR